MLSNSVLSKLSTVQSFDRIDSSSFTKDTFHSSLSGVSQNDIFTLTVWMIIHQPLNYILVQYSECFDRIQSAYYLYIFLPENEPLICCRTGHLICHIRIA